MFTVLFSAGEKAALAVDHLATWGEQAAKAMSEEAANERLIKELEAKQRFESKKREIEAANAGE